MKGGQTGYLSFFSLMRINPNQLQAALQRQLSPVYVVAGQELLVIVEACEQIRRACAAAGVEERIVLHAEGGFDWNQLGQSTETGSLFASRRLVDLRLPSGKPGREGGAALREWVERGSDDILLLSCQQWDLQSERTAWFKALEQAGTYVPAWTVKPHQLPGWLSARLQSRGLQADRAAIRFLADRLEGNLLAAAQEVDRLAMYFGRGQVGLDELRAAVADNARFTAFRLVELVLQGQAGAAVRCARSLAAEATPPVPVIAALAREIAVLVQFLARGPGVFKELKVWEARQQPIRAAADRLDDDAVARGLSRLAALDCIAKGQRKGDFWQTLERFILEFCVLPHTRSPEWGINPANAA